MSTTSSQTHHLVRGWGNFTQMQCLISSGDNGKAVYVAKETGSGQLVKITSWQVITNQEAEARQFKEAEELCNLCSELPEDVFVRPLWYWSENQTFFLGTDHNPGYKPIDMIQHDNSDGNHQNIAVLDMVEMIHLSCFLIDAVHAMHKLDIFHGHINRSTILILDKTNQDSSNVIREGYAFKLTNLVPMTLMSADTQQHRATLPPPETHTSRSYGSIVTHASTKDIWCMGMTLLELAIGLQASDVNKKIINRFLRGQADLEREVLNELPMKKKLLWGMQNPWTRELILRCLTVKVSERTSAAQLASWPTFRAIRELLPFLHNNPSSPATSSSLPVQRAEASQSKADEVDDIDIWQDFPGDYIHKRNSNETKTNQGKKPDRRPLANTENFLNEFGIDPENMATVSIDMEELIFGRIGAGNQEQTDQENPDEYAAYVKASEDLSKGVANCNSAALRDQSEQQEQAAQERALTVSTDEGNNNEYYQDNNAQIMQHHEDQVAPVQASEESTKLAIISPKYFDNELAHAEEIRRNKRPRSILKSTANPNLHEEMEKVRSMSSDSGSGHESVRRVRSREPTNDDGLNVLFLNDIRSLHRLLDKGKLPSDYEGFWLALKHANNSWRRFPRVKGMQLESDDADKDAIYTNAMGLKEDNYLRYHQGVDYFCGSEEFLDFVLEQCRLKGSEESLVTFIEGIKAKVEDEKVKQKNKGGDGGDSDNCWRNKRRRSI